MADPGNYSVEWVEQMRSLAVRKERAVKDLTRAVEMDGVHFQLPDRGWILDGSYNGTMTGAQMRPPFPVTVVEYSFNSGVDPYGRTMNSTRRMLIALDNEGYGNGAVSLVPLFYIDQTKLWSPPMIAWDFEYDDTEYVVTRNAKDIAVTMHPRIILPKQVKEYRSLHGFSEEFLLRQMMQDHSDEIMSYMGMCKALALRAVDTTESVPDPKKQSVRKIMSKRPLHAYRVLTLTPGVDLYPRNDAETGRTHASPRAHWRRGHMRTMKKTGKQVWVNACMISGAGMIVKDYRVEGINRD